MLTKGGEIKYWWAVEGNETRKRIEGVQRP